MKTLCTTAAATCSLTSGLKIPRNIWRSLSLRQRSYASCSDGGATGLIAAAGNFGAVTTLLGTATRVGGLLVNALGPDQNGFSGQLVVLGNDYGDLTFHGGLTGGRIAVQGTGGAQSGIVSNVIVDRGIYSTDCGVIDAGSAIVSGGEIGDA